MNNTNVTLPRLAKAGMGAFAAAFAAKIRQQ